MSTEKNDLLDPELPASAAIQKKPDAVDAFRDALIDALDKKSLILKKLFPDALPSIDEIERRCPPRELPEAAMVTRIAPSPTGFMHIGGIYTAMISERLARQSDGVFYLRIEDTDQKREVEGASALIANSLAYYGIKVDEGPVDGDREAGTYGPYKQSERQNLYRAYVKDLIAKGLAYPCFCTREDLERLREAQESDGRRPGYYGEDAIWRSRSEDEVLDALNSQKPYVIRFRSPGHAENRVAVRDLLKGAREFPENDHDIVIMKSDGLPTYHFAHVVDDHLMHTTHVVRGDEWFNSLPLHIQLFKSMGWQAPQYGHLMPIQKMDGESKRKLSKRKDPEADVRFYMAQGYPIEAVVEYLMNLANSNFEEWRRQNPHLSHRDFKFNLDRLGKSNGALFDFKKLDDISRDVISRYTAADVYEKALLWAQAHSPHMAALLERDPEYSIRIFKIDREGSSKVRKDIAKWSDVEREIGFYFDEVFHHTEGSLLSDIEPVGAADARLFIQEVIDDFDSIFASQKWFDAIKIISEKMGFALSTKALRDEPDKYKGSVGDLVKVMRLLLTGRSQSPDLFFIIGVLGKERSLRRLKNIF